MVYLQNEYLVDEPKEHYTSHHSTYNILTTGAIPKSNNYKHWK